MYLKEKAVMLVARSEASLLVTWMQFKETTCYSNGYLFFCCFVIVIESLKLDTFNIAFLLILYIFMHACCM